MVIMSIGHGLSWVGGASVGNIIPYWGTVRTSKLTAEAPPFNWSRFHAEKEAQALLQWEISGREENG